MNSDLIERLKERASSETVLGCVMIGVEELEEAISALESSQWVKCSERMPDPGPCMLFDGEEVGEGYFTESGSWEWVTGVPAAPLVGNELYWSVIPAPPKVEQGDK